VQFFDLASLCYVKKKVVRKNFRDEKLLTYIGSKIREVRISKGISQETLANECEVDYSQIHRMELGKVNFNVSNLYKISAALKIDPKLLLP
jgi:ribosome-binding protein aMBF1 (putative translation factor)